MKIKFKIIFLIIIPFFIFVSLMQDESILVGEYNYHMYNLDGTEIFNKSKNANIYKSLYVNIKVYKQDKDFLFVSLYKDYLVNGDFINAGVAKLLLSFDGFFKYYESKFERDDKEYLKFGLNPKDDPVLFYFKYSYDQGKLYLEKKYIDNMGAVKENSKKEYKNFENFTLVADNIISLIYLEKGLDIIEKIKKNELSKIPDLKIASFQFDKIFYYNAKIVEKTDEILEINGKKYNSFRFKIKIILPPFMEFLNNTIAKKNTIIDCYIDKDGSKILKYNNETYIYVLEE